MLYNRHLDWLIVVSDTGSFSKAAQQLYVSSTAVMKQMDGLEKQLGFKILNRSNQGVSLTEAGQSIYEDAKFMINYSQQAVQQANQVANNTPKIIRIGTSFLNPYHPIRELWLEISTKHPEYKLQIIPFESESNSKNNIFDYIDELFDLVVGGFDDNHASLSIYPLDYLCFQCLISPGHPLAKQEKITIEDLAEYPVLMSHLGESKQQDELRQKLLHQNEESVIKNIPFYYGMEIFNEVYTSNDILLAYEGWQDRHPSLISVPLEWDGEIPYGILYANDASQEVINFIKLITNEKLSASS